MNNELSERIARELDKQGMLAYGPTSSIPSRQNRVAAIIAKHLPQSDIEPSEAERETIVEAIADMEEAQLSHLHWAEHFEKHPELERQYEATGEWDTAQVHRAWVAKYDKAIRLLALVPFSAPQLAQPGEVWEKAISQIPTNWCDPLLSGPKATLRGLGGTWGCPDIERLLHGGKARLEAARDASPQPAAWQGISFDTLLAVLDRLKSKNQNQNPERQWYVGWNAALDCLINDINARAVAPLPAPPDADVLSTTERDQLAAEIFQQITCNDEWHRSEIATRPCPDCDMPPPEPVAVEPPEDKANG